MKVILLYSMSVQAPNKNGLIEFFEIISRFPNTMLVKSGDITVDAHSLIGVFSLDINKPIELIMDNEPDENFKQAIEKFIPA